jgi:hypothetical protein
LAFLTPLFQQAAKESLALMQRAEAGFGKALGPEHPFSKTAKLGVELIQGRLSEK